MNYFISITHLITLIETHLPENPIYAEITQTVNSFSRQFFITISDVQDGTGRYWRYYCGQSENFDEVKIREILLKAGNYLEQVEKHLQEKGFQVVQGVITFPNNLELLEGVTDLIKKDEVSH